jgi:hypothetical protein
MDALGSRSIAAEKPKLSSENAQSLAEGAAQKAFVDLTSFDHRSPTFDPVTRVWSIEFRETMGRAKRFSVFVYDATSHTEVTCLGRSSFGQAMDKSELPEEVRPFVPEGDNAIDLVCGDLDGEGKQDYLLVSQSEQRRQTLSVLLRTPDGKLSAIVRNPRISDGWFGTLIARRERIEVINTIEGNGGGDIFTFYFQYSAPDKTWLLTRAEKGFSGDAPFTNDEHPFTQLPRDFGRITIDGFRFDAFSGQ